MREHWEGPASGTLSDVSHRLESSINMGNSVFIPDNLPGHVFETKGDSNIDSVTCSQCGLALTSFLSDPYPKYDRLKLEEFRRARTVWVQGSGMINTAAISTAIIIFISLSPPEDVRRRVLRQTART